MGTNYYLETDFCPCCGKARQRLHIGKKTCGWKFLFHKQPRIFDFASFTDAILRGIIYDGYGRKISKDELLQVIANSLNAAHHDDAEIIDGYDFLGTDFC